MSDPAPHDPPDASRRARWLLLLVGVLAAGVIVGQTWFAVRGDEQQTRQVERAHGLTVLRLLEEHTGRVLRDAESGLDGLEREIERERHGQPADSRLIREVLTRAEPFNRTVTSFQYVNTEGVASVNSIDYPAFQTDADDRTYVAGLLRQPQRRDTVLGRPFARFYDGEQILPLARNFRTRDGQYQGLLSTDISLAYFWTFYRRTAQEEHAQVALVLDDGVLVVRDRQGAGDIGRDLSRSRLPALLRAAGEEGSFEGRGLLDAQDPADYVFLTRRVQGYPVRVVYARRIDDLMQGPRGRTGERLAIAGAMLAGFALLGAMLWRQFGHLERSRRLLERSEHRFESLFQRSPLPLAMIRLRDDHIIEANQLFLSLFGYRADEVIGRTPLELGMWMKPAERPAYLRLLREQGHVERYEALLTDRHGRSMPCTLSAQIIDSDEGPLAVFSPMDLSHEREAEARLRQLEGQLLQAQKLEAVGTLAGGIAHDFNNILAAILGNVGMARLDTAGEHPARPYLDEIQKAAARARRLVRQILAFSRRQPHEMFHQPLHPIVEETMALLRATLPAGCSMQLDLCREPLVIHADATQVQQVLMNLCTNAWSALQGRPGRVTVGAEAATIDERSDPRLGGLAPGAYAHLWVADTGTGIPEASLHRIFEPFFTTKPVGQGTGLGLSMVHGIVTAHAGAILVDSQPGEGSTFHVYLPLAATESPAAAADDGAGQVAPPAGQGHVLYVDDDDVLLLMVRRLLERCGYRVTCLQHASEALALLAEPGPGPDLLVTDFNMPDISGLDVAAAAARLRPDLPVIVTSGFITEDLRAGTERLGVRALLQKEHTLEALPDLVREHLRTGGRERHPA